MRLLHSVSSSSFELYHNSFQFEGINKRQIKAEDLSWDSNLVKRLAEIAVNVITLHFRDNTELNNIQTAEGKLFFLEDLPTDLPISITIPHLTDGKYWERMSKARWKSMNDVSIYGHSWRRLYLERNLEECLECMTPDMIQTEENRLQELLQLSAPYVYRLKLKQLLPKASEQNEIRCNPKQWPDTYHINLENILLALRNLQELHLVFGVAACSMDFEWNLFKLTLNDCNNIGRAIKKLESVRLLRIHRSNLDDSSLICLLKHVEDSGKLHELDLSNCKIEDKGVEALGKLLARHPTLTRLKLCNNKIGPEGIQNFMSRVIKSKPRRLELLDLKLNSICDVGGVPLCAAIADNFPLEALIVAGCGFSGQTGQLLGSAIMTNNILLTLDVSNNNLGLDSGGVLFKGMEHNTTLKTFDIRMTGIDEKAEENINNIVRTNWQRRKSNQ